jgi:hypothetical protein
MQVVSPNFTVEQNLKMLEVPGQRFQHYVNISGSAHLDPSLGPDDDADDDTFFEFEVQIDTAPRWILPPNWVGPNSPSVHDVSPNAWISGWKSADNDEVQFFVGEVTWSLVDNGKGGLQVRLHIKVVVKGGSPTNVYFLGYCVAVVGSLAPEDANSLTV